MKVLMIGMGQKKLVLTMKIKSDNIYKELIFPDIEINVRYEGIKIVSLNVGVLPSNG
jgi:hypothetical protein